MGSTCSTFAPPQQQNYLLFYLTYHTGGSKLSKCFWFPGFDHAAKDPVDGVHVVAPDTEVVLVEGWVASLI